MTTKGNNRKPMCEVANSAVCHSLYAIYEERHSIERPAKIMLTGEGDDYTVGQKLNTISSTLYKSLFLALEKQYIDAAGAADSEIMQFVDAVNARFTTPIALITQSKYNERLDHGVTHVISAFDEKKSLSDDQKRTLCRNFITAIGMVMQEMFYVTQKQLNNKPILERFIATLVDSWGVIAFKSALHNLLVNELKENSEKKPVKKSSGGKKKETEKKEVISPAESSVTDDELSQL